MPIIIPSDPSNDPSQPSSALVEPSAIQSEIQKLATSAIVELFTIDTTKLGSGIFHFHAGTNKLLNPVVWQGVTYFPLPIEAEGFDLTTTGALPRPKIRIANVGGVFSELAAQNNDLVGSVIIRKQTFARYLDAVNFPNGNPDADPNQYLPDQRWFVDRKVSENRYIIEWELASAFDLSGVMLPYRQIIKNSCPWEYRGPECGWDGEPYNKADQPCAINEDFCAKKLSSCQVRFKEGVIPFGGFPGATRYD